MPPSRLILSLLLAAGWCVGTAAPVLRAADPASPARQEAAPADVAARRAAALAGDAIRRIDRRRWPEAQATLERALALDPGNAVHLYNLACVLARQGDADRAIDALRRAAAAGFTDFTLAARDADLASLRADARFRAFLADKAVWQRRAAERVLENLRGRFGPDYLYEIDHDLKLIFATGVDRATLDELKVWLTRQARSQGADLFEHRPDAFVSVVIPSAADFRKVVWQENVAGAYYDATKMHVAKRPGDFMAHEFTHALHAADRAPLGQEHAIWVAEGLAVMYEGARVIGDALVPTDNRRTPITRAAAQRRSLIPLAHLVAMTPDTFVARGRMTYPQAGSLMLYLRERGWLREFYDAYKAGYDDDPTGRAALESVTGMTLDALEEGFVQWLLTRPSIRPR